MREDKLGDMQFLLLHSPVVSKETWRVLVSSLEASGFEATVVALDNSAHHAEALYEHHVTQIESAMSHLTRRRIITVAHSGAGSLLALLNPRLIAGYVFLDAIFPMFKASRFDLFDDARVVERWREIAARHKGVLPRVMLARFGEQVVDPDIRHGFVSGLVDVPIELYEEPIPVHPDWPPARRGLFVQWTDSYSADAKRAASAGFEVRVEPGSHFEMLNQPDEVARTLIDFASAIG